MATTNVNTNSAFDADDIKDDFMVKHFNDPKLNSYEEGPGHNLPEQLALPNRKCPSNCSVYIAFVPANLDSTGIKNLCSKYGQVKEVQKRMRRYEHIFDSLVQFASVADAENAIYNINKLRFKVKGKMMKADFDNRNSRQPQEPEELTFHPVHGDISKSEFHLPLGTPSPLLRPNGFDNQRATILLESSRKFPTILNGCTSYRHSPHSIAMMEELATKSTGYFDENTQHFVHNATLDFGVAEQCKNCDSPTIKFCKGCKDPFCSMYCLKEYNKGDKGGCYCCVSSRIAEVIAKKPNRISAGRGGKLLCPRVVPPRSCSMSSTDSDTYSTGSSSRKRMEPCDLPKNNELVIITNVVSNKIVYLRSFEPNNNERYHQYLNDVAEYAKAAPPLDEMPKMGDIVLAEHDGCYYRALVARIETAGVIVAAFLELGSVVFTPLSNLKKLREDLQNVQRFVFKAFLSGMDRQNVTNDKCLIYLYDLLERRVPLKFISKEIDASSEHCVHCELVVSEKNENVNGKLTTLNHITLGQPVMDIPIKAFDASATEAIVIDKSLAVTGIVTVTTPEHMSDMFNMHQRIQEYCKEDYKSPYTPQLNEICLAKFNEQWYRVKLETSFGDKNPVMFFIDFALFNKVHVDNMRRMPAEFVFPLYSAMAEIGGISDATDFNKLADIFRVMSKVSVAKVELENGNPEEPRIYFNIPGGLPKIEATTSPSVHKPRLQQLENLRRTLKL